MTEADKPQGYRGAKGDIVVKMQEPLGYTYRMVGISGIVSARFAAASMLETISGGQAVYFGY
jgi:hypothetical protein